MANETHSRDHPNPGRTARRQGRCGSVRDCACIGVVPERAQARRRDRGRCLTAAPTSPAWTGAGQARPLPGASWPATTDTYHVRAIRTTHAQGGDPALAGVALLTRLLAETSSEGTGAWVTRAVKAGSLGRPWHEWDRTPSLGWGPCGHHRRSQVQIWDGHDEGAAWRTFPMGEVLLLWPR